MLAWCIEFRAPKNTPNKSTNCIPSRLPPARFARHSNSLPVTSAISNVNIIGSSLVNIGWFTVKIYACSSYREMWYLVEEGVLVWHHRYLDWNIYIRFGQFTIYRPSNKIYIGHGSDVLLYYWVSFQINDTYMAGLLAQHVYISIGRENLR